MRELVNKDRSANRQQHWMAAASLLAVLSLAGFGPLVAQQLDEQETVQVNTQLNINTADAEALAARLVGVGLVKAQEIVLYREKFGDFVAIEELADVKGIGMATVEKNRHLIVLSASQQSAGQQQGK